MKNQEQFLVDFVSRVFANDCKKDVNDVFRAVEVHYDARTQQVYLDFYKTDQLQELPTLLAQATIEAAKRLQAQADDVPRRRPYIERINDINRRYARRTTTTVSEYYHRHFR